MAAKQVLPPGRCPKCGRPTQQTEPRFFWCNRCQMAHDDDPDEGGDYSTNPAARMIREERRNEPRPSRRRIG